MNFHSSPFTPSLGVLFFLLLPLFCLSSRKKKLNSFKSPLQSGSVYRAYDREFARTSENDLLLRSMTKQQQSKVRVSQKRSENLRHYKQISVTRKDTPAVERDERAQWSSPATSTRQWSNIDDEKFTTSSAGCPFQFLI